MTQPPTPALIVDGNIVDLAAMQTMLQSMLIMAEKLMGSHLSPEQQESARTIHSNSAQLECSIKAIINASHVELQKTEEPPEPNDVSYGLPMYQAKVLFVEASKVNRMMAECMLMDMGCEVELAETGTEALAMCQAASYDMIFMDCLLPEMDGYALTRAIRNDTGNNNHQVVIVAIADELPDENWHHCLDAGMNDFMVKPLKMGSIHRMLSRHINSNLQNAGSNIHFLDGFDEERFDHYRHMMGDNFERAIADFMDYAETMINTLKKAHEINNLHEVGIIARALHSISAVIGANTLADAAWAIQEDVYTRLTNAVTGPLNSESVQKLIDAFSSLHSINSFSKRKRA